MTEATLHLVRMELDLRRLFALCERQRVPLGDDLGHAVHCGLGAAFGDAAPKIFSVTHHDSSRRGQGRTLEMLAYSDVPLAQLHEAAEIGAEPDAYRLLDWERCADKPMPSSWRAGQRLGFRTRVCPTVRTSKEGPKARAGAEIDAFLSAARRDASGPKPDREVVYTDWLRAAIARPEVAELESATMESFTLASLLRRTHSTPRRAPRSLRKPDVTFDGILEIKNPSSFTAFLRRGLGRHRAFGFGMLLLRPAGGR